MSNNLSDKITIQSYKGEYEVEFNHGDIAFSFSEEELANSHFIIDKNIAQLYKKQLEKILTSSSVLLIDATEENKSLQHFPTYIEHLVTKKLRRNHRLIAIGGGITQDITCFLAATMLRGVDWWFYPTTLLAQADSCIGSKSSINSGSAKNILGTFTPPKKIFIHTKFLKTLDKTEVCSGVGEMLKIHAIDSTEAYAEIANNYDTIFSNDEAMLDCVRRSLEIKKRFIEQDEFDKNIRNVLNFGHTFGHAIESATQYKIPHGIAVTIGMDMANYVAYQLGFGSEENYQRIHPTLKKNYQDFMQHQIPFDLFITAISKDKKNIGTNKIGAILLNNNAKAERIFLDNNQKFKEICTNYLETKKFQ